MGGVGHDLSRKRPSHDQCGGILNSGEVFLAALGLSVLNRESAIRRKPLGADFGQDRIFIRICVGINNKAVLGQCVYLGSGLGLG